MLLVIYTCTILQYYKKMINWMNENTFSMYSIINLHLSVQIIWKDNFDHNCFSMRKGIQMYEHNLWYVMIAYRPH